MAANRHAVESVLLANEELFEQSWCICPRRNRLDPASKRRHVIEPVCRLSPGARGRLSHERKADRLRERERLGSLGDELVPSARNAGSAKHRFHAGLVAYVESGLQVHAIEAELLTGIRHGHLQLLKGADEPLYGAHLLAEAAYGFNELLRVERVVHPPMPVEVLLQLWRQSVGRLRRNDGKAYVRELGGSENETRGCGKQKRCDEGGDHHGQDVTR